jgi:hypothetical protein
MYGLSQSDASLQALRQKPSEPASKLTKVNLGVKGNLANIDRFGNIAFCRRKQALQNQILIAQNSGARVSNWDFISRYFRAKRSCLNW